MIELNLTYEESKKIFELGYDFTEICTEWQHNFYPPNGDPSKGKIVKWFRLGEHLVNPTLASMLTHHELDLEKTYTIDIEEALADLKNYKMGDEYTPLIPIVPKAALEACLPESIWSYPQGSHLDITNGRIGYVLNGKQIPFVRFDSVYEAFLWCHEKAQKELKKKFEEVMK